MKIVFDKNRNNPRWEVVGGDYVSGEEIKTDFKEKIKVEVNKWVECQLEGNINCPICNEQMNLMPTLGLYASCRKCRKVFRGTK
jgi:hypothetical protein